MWSQLERSLHHHILGSRIGKHQGRNRNDKQVPTNKITELNELVDAGVNLSHDIICDFQRSPISNTKAEWEIRLEKQVKKL